MDFQIKYSSRADMDIDGIKDYISQCNKDAAANMVLRILQSIKMLKSFPLIGRKGRIAGTRELVIPDLNYIAFYRIADEYIYIERILHTSRQFPDSYKK